MTTSRSIRSKSRSSVLPIKGIPNDPSGNGGGFVFDCRAINNPGKYERYNHFTGLDEPVIRFLEEDGEITRFLDHAYEIVDASVKRYMDRGFTNLMICFGCTGASTVRSTPPSIWRNIFILSSVSGRPRTQGTKH